MNILRKWAGQAFEFGAKVLSADDIRHPAGGTWYGGPTRPTDRLMTKEVGKGLDTNVIMSPIRWIQRAANEAIPVLEDAKGEQTTGHPLIALLNQPNPFYSGKDLMAATILSLKLSGDAYWQIAVNQGKIPIQLWYIPHWLIEPKWPRDGDVFISHYSYKAGNGPDKKLLPGEVIQFRDGINPENVRKGLAPLRGLLAEMWSDMEASSFVAAILNNGGVPGALFTPRGEGTLKSEDVSEMKDYLDTQFTGSNKGKFLVGSQDMRYEQIGLDPSKLDVSSIGNRAEERVCAALGIPAAVVGFGTGMQQTKVGATMKELRKEAWQGGVIPVLNVLASEITRALLPQFRQRSALKVAYDVSHVEALSEGKDAKEKRAKEQLSSGAITINEYRIMIGKDEVGDGNVYLREFRFIEVPAGQQGRTIESGTQVAAKQRFQTKDSHTALELRIAEEAPRLSKPPLALVKLADRIDAIREKGRGPFANDLETFFKRLGATAGRVAKEVLGDGKSKAVETKNDAEARLTSGRIQEGMELDGELPIFAKLFEKHYFNAAEDTAKAISGAIGIEAGVPDPVARSILATAGRRAGLVDLSKQTTDAVFKALVQAEAEGIGPVAAARRIRDAVGSGPWSTPAIRAKTIARTEMSFATNISSLEIGKDFGAEKAVVFDARLGSTDSICEALNGRVVTLDEARQLTFDEHTNGTRSFSPIPPGMEL